MTARSRPGSGAITQISCAVPYVSAGPVSPSLGGFAAGTDAELGRDGGDAVIDGLGSIRLHLAAEGKAAKTVRPIQGAVVSRRPSSRAGETHALGGGREAGRAGGSRGCWAGTTPPTPVTGTGRCSRSS